MKVNKILTSLFLIPFSSIAQQGYTIHGQIGKNFDKPTRVLLVYTKDTTTVIDSTVINTGLFSFKGKVPYPIQAEVAVQDNPSKKFYEQNDMLSFYLENSDIAIYSNDSLSHASVKGSKTNEEALTLEKIQSPYDKTSDSLMEVYNSLTPEQQKDSLFLIPARKIMMATQDRYNSVTREFIYSHLNSYMSLQMFRGIELAYNFNPDTAQQRFNKLSLALRNSIPGTGIQTIIEKQKATMLGKIAPDFEERDTLGNPIKLSDFRGHYVLLDFWASWCAPCRAENPNLKAAYKKYKDNNFTVLSVSLDEGASRENWAKAVKQDSLPWTQVSELKGFKGKSAVLYGINAIPSNFLIDPTGKIIARNLRGDDLDNKLSALFNKK